MPSGHVVGTTGVLDPGRKTQTITKHYSKCFVEAWRELTAETAVE
jgi:hypothetical protein